jgi:hypothetical protein
MVPMEAPLIVHPFAAKRVAENKYVLLDYWCKPAILRVAAVSRKVRAYWFQLREDYWFAAESLKLVRK